MRSEPSLATARAVAGGEQILRILVVDDEEILAASLKRLLGPNVAETCAGGAEAVERFVGGQFDVMLCDLRMPGFGGSEVYEAVKARRPGLERRIVFMSGGIWDREKSFIEAAGCRWVQKPFEMRELKRIASEVAATNPGP